MSKAYMIIYGWMDIYIYDMVSTLIYLHHWHYLLKWASSASLADCWLFGPWRHELSSATMPGWRLKHIEDGAVQKAVNTKVSRSQRDEMMLSKLRQKAGHMSSSWMGFGMEPVPDRSQQSWPLLLSQTNGMCVGSETVVWTITSVDPALIAA